MCFSLRCFMFKCLRSTYLSIDKQHSLIYLEYHIIDNYLKENTF